MSRAACAEACDPSAPHLKPKIQVVISGLIGRAELNECTGALLRYDVPSARWDVRLQIGGRHEDGTMRVRSSNLARAPMLEPGAFADVCGLVRRSELNGRRCVLQRIKGDSGRWVGLLASGAEGAASAPSAGLKLKPENLRALPPPEVQVHRTPLALRALALAQVWTPADFVVAGRELRTAERARSGKLVIVMSMLVNERSATREGSARSIVALDVLRGRRQVGQLAVGESRVVR
jgi:hypothetical protein